MSKALTLKKLLIKTRKQVFSEIIGNNTSPLKGEGYDFLELKEYEYGEDAKNIDWIISAKLQKPYVKVFHAQKELNIHIVPMLTGSVYFGTSKMKQEIITEVCSILGYSSVKQGDPFSLHIANSSLETITKRTKRLHSVHQMAESIYNYDVLGKSINYATIADQLYKQIKKRSIIFLVGDFFDCSSLDLKLLSRKHEVYVIMTRDHFEEEPQQLNNVNLIDPNNYSNFEGNIDKASIKSYKTILKKNDHKLFEHLQKCGIKVTKIYTNEEPISKMIGLLQR